MNPIKHTFIHTIIEYRLNEYKLAYYKHQWFTEIYIMFIETLAPIMLCVCVCVFGYDR